MYGPLKLKACQELSNAPDKIIPFAYSLGLYNFNLFSIHLKYN